MAEYGNPDTDDWKNYMKSRSPYQNLDATKNYPKVLFCPSTRNDRVHPRPRPQDGHEAIAQTTY